MTDPFSINIENLIPTEDFQSLAGDVKAELDKQPGQNWGRALTALGGAKISSAISDQLGNTDLLQLFASGWGTLTELRAFKDQEKYPPEKQSSLKLGKFTQSLSLNPVLTLAVAGMQSGPLRFTITFKGGFDAIELAIKNAHIIAVGGGMCSLSAGIKFGDIELPSKLPPLAIKLLDNKEFPAPGLPII